MKRSLTAALAAVLVLSSCGMVRESRLNPFNWFGRSERVQTYAPAEEAVDPRDLVGDVVSLAIEPYSGGAIVRATGVMDSQGWWNAELVEVEGEGQEAGHLVLDFRVLPPATQTPVGTQRTREVTAAITLTPRRLENIAKITVQGKRSARTTRR